MTKSGCTRKGGFPFIKSLFLMLALLCLFCNGDIQLMKNGLNTMMKSLQTLLEEAVNGQKEELARIEAISELLDEAKSLTNTEQLETFLQDLQQAAEEEYENKVVGKFAMEIVTKQYDVKMLELLPQLQQMKMAQNKDPSIYQVGHGLESLSKKVKIYCDLKNKLFAGEAKDTAKNLNNIVNILKSKEVHEEL